MKHLLTLIIIVFSVSFFGCDNSGEGKVLTTEESIHKAVTKYYKVSIEEGSPFNSLDTVIIVKWDTLTDRVQAEFDANYIFAHLQVEAIIVAQMNKKLLDNMTKIILLKKNKLLKKDELETMIANIDIDTMPVYNRRIEARRLVQVALALEASFGTLDTTNFLGYYTNVQIKMSDSKGAQKSSKGLLRISSDFKIMEVDYESLGIKVFD